MDGLFRISPVYGDSMAFPSRQAAIVGVYTTEQARFLERTLAPLVVAPSSTGLREVGALLASLARRPAGR